MKLYFIKNKEEIILLKYNDIKLKLFFYSNNYKKNKNMFIQYLSKMKILIHKYSKIFNKMFIK
jgi:hypothetical protein